MSEIATAVYGALGIGPRGEAVEVSHMREDVEARLAGLTLMTAATPSALAGHFAGPRFPDLSRTAGSRHRSGV
ncbi:hypothetical protein [Streptomyces uncialis]|uniref:hypothetical protein n=1 Tax=Streptomyces uncialis TaxID=1048205 RepID=UPI0033D5950D